MKFVLKRELLRKLAVLEFKMEALTMRVEALEKPKKVTKKITTKKVS